MGINQDYVIEWRGEERTIPAGMRLRAIAAVESVITLQELERQRASNQYQFATLAEAFAVMLRFAGVNMTLDDKAALYEALTTGSTKQMTETIVAAVTVLLSFFLPPTTDAKGASSGNPLRRTQAAARSSKKPIRRR